MILGYSKNELLGAKQKLEKYIHRTPVLQSRLINEIAGAQLFFKCENFQKVGAFKMRGAMHKLLCLSDKEKSFGVVTHSSGNFGQALALSAQLLNISATVIMPSNAPQVKKDAVAGYGAQIIECSPSIEAREESLRLFLLSHQATFCHPYNDENVILGNSTAAQELFEDYKLDDIIAPVGGGGLMSGTALAAKYFSPQTSIYGAEPVAANDAYKSLRDAKIYPSISPNTIADGLLTALGNKTYPVLKELLTEILLVNDKDILKSMKLIWERMKIIVEPSAAISLAVVLKNPKKFENRKVGLILSGGNVDLKKYFD